MAAVFVNFSENKCNFLHKTSSIPQLGPTPHRAGSYEEFVFSWGSCHHCPIEVGTCGYRHVHDDGSAVIRKQQKTVSLWLRRGRYRLIDSNRARMAASVGSRLVIVALLLGRKLNKLSSFLHFISLFSCLLLFCVLCMITVSLSIISGILSYTQCDVLLSCSCLYTLPYCMV